MMGEVAPYRDAEAKRRPERAALVVVDPPGCREPEHAHALELGRGVGVPVAKCQVRDVVSGPCEVEGKVSHPPFCAADGLRKEMVVDETDAHD
jgi:hypothetical protein